jgi:hypothetical protein
MDGGTDGWQDGWMDGKLHFVHDVLYYMQSFFLLMLGMTQFLTGSPCRSRVRPQDNAWCCTPPKDHCLGEGEDITRRSRLCGRGHPSAGPTSGNALVEGPTQGKEVAPPKVSKNWWGKQWALFDRWVISFGRRATILNRPPSEPVIPGFISSYLMSFLES